MKEETIVCAKFQNEEEGLRFLSRVAQLQPGTVISWRTTEGLRRGVFVKLDDIGRVLALFVKDGDFCSFSINPGCLVFDDIACEYEAPQEEIDESVDIDELPRT